MQGSLIEWAAAGARFKGREGIEEFLALYRKLPESEMNMRGKMIIHVSKLLTGAESLTLVLSDWYRALMDESTLVRYNAIKAWENVPFDLVKHFPDLFFEAFSVSLSDPYVIVHRAAVHTLRRRSFPEEKRSFIKSKLGALIIHYANKDKPDDFIVDCIDTFTYLGLSSDGKNGEIGQFLSAILLRLEEGALYHAVDRLGNRLKGVPGFTKVALKAIQDDYTRSISIDDCISVILRASTEELQNCVDDIKKAFKALKPFRPEDFVEALVYVAALTRAGNFMDASVCFRELEKDIPSEDRYELWQLETALVAVASEIEHAIQAGEPFTELIEQWNNLQTQLEKENEERSKLQDFPTNFYF